MSKVEFDAAATLKIYDEMDQGGKTALTKFSRGEGSINLRKFEGTGLVVASTFTSQSAQPIIDLAERIYHIGEQTGVSLSVLGRNGIPPHGTVLDGKHPGDSAARASVYGTLAHDEEVAPITASLNGLTFKLDRLIIEDRDVLLVASVPPMEILQAREDLRQIYGRYGLEKPKPRDQIFFVTLARLKELPSQGGIPSYLAQMETIQREIAMKPIEVQTDIPFLGPANQLIPQEMLNS